MSHETDDSVPTGQAAFSPLNSVERGFCGKMGVSADSASYADALLTFPEDVIAWLCVGFIVGQLSGFLFTLARNAIVLYTLFALLGPMPNALDILLAAALTLPLVRLVQTREPFIWLTTTNEALLLRWPKHPILVAAAVGGAHVVVHFAVTAAILTTWMLQP